MHAFQERLSILKHGLITITKVILAVALSLGTVILGLTLSLQFKGIALPQPPGQSRDSAAIVVEADVKNWEPIIPDGRVDATKPDRRINVVRRAVVIGVDNFIVRFNVVKVVNGVFDFDEVHMLIHSPSQSGVRDADQKFVLTLSRRSEQPEVIASSNRRSQGLSYFTFAEPLYELVSATPPLF
jgi:hypothetical protein